MEGLTRYTPQALAVLRIVTALLFIAHGTMKLFNFPASEMSPPIGSIFWFAGVIEVVGGVLILLGLFTRPVAFVLAGEMAVANFMAHAPQGFFPVMNGGDISDAGKLKSFIVPCAMNRSAVTMRSTASACGV